MAGFGGGLVYFEVWEIVAKVECCACRRLLFPKTTPPRKALDPLTASAVFVHCRSEHQSFSVKTGLILIRVLVQAPALISPLSTGDLTRT